MWLEEYRRSLKMPEAEEVLDLMFYRPIAFVFVKLIYRLPITPNGVTFLSLICGLASAWYFSLGTDHALLLAAVWYAAANILDCSDGQLARLQKSGTLLGRVVDGVVDYISSVAIFLGIGTGMSASGHEGWLVVVIAGLSSALHAILFDRYQSEFISTVRAEVNFHDREVERFSEEISRMREEKRDGIKRFFLRIYLWYLEVQQPSNATTQSRQADPQKYREGHLTMIRLWSLLGPTTNRSLLICCALLGKVEYFLWIVIIAGNSWLVLCFFLQRKIHDNVLLKDPHAV